MFSWTFYVALDASFDHVLFNMDDLNFIFLLPYFCYSWKTLANNQYWVDCGCFDLASPKSEARF